MGGRGASYGGGNGGNGGNTGNGRNGGNGGNGGNSEEYKIPLIDRRLKFWDYTPNSLGSEEFEKSLINNVERSSRMVGSDYPSDYKLYSAPQSSQFSRAYAFVVEGENTIYINKDLFSNQDKLNSLYDHDLSSNYHPKGTSVNDILVHENGHVAVNQLYERTKGKTFMGTEIRNFNDLPKAIVNVAVKNVNSKSGTSTSVRNLRESISKYAGTNYNETIAEAFADYYANGIKANALSKEIVNLVRRPFR